MKLFQHLFHNEHKYQNMFVFILVFYLAMGVSKYAQILFFQQNHGLLNYSLSYSAMAVAGSFSFLISNNLANWGLKKIVKVFLPIYAVGMLLRVIPNNAFIALISGIIAGFGASITLLVIRSWIYFESDQDEAAKEVLVSSRYTIMQIATLMATMVAGWLISVVHAANYMYWFLIVLAAVLMGSLSLTNSIPYGRVQKKPRNLFVALPTNRLAGILLFLLVFLLGLTNALIDPILPAILRKAGLKISAVTVWTTIFSVLTVLTSLFYQRSHLRISAGGAFLINEVLVGCSMLVAVLNFNQGTYISLIAYTIMSIGIAGFFIFKELMEYDMFPKAESFLYLGIAQSGFLVGDALGSPVGTLLFQQAGTKWLILIYGVLTIVCGLSYSLFYFYLRKLNNSASH